MALAFCLGVSLLEKAVSYSLVLKPKNFGQGQRNKKLRKGLEVLKSLKKKIYPCIDRDSVIFAKIMANQGARRRQFIQQSEKIIIQLADSSQKAFLLAKALESGIKKSIISDYYIGLELIKIALLGSILNLEANQTMFGRKNRYINKFKKALEKWQRS